MVIVTPTGLDQFLEELTVIAKDMTEPDVRLIEKLMNSYGVELMGSPLTA